MTVFQKIIDREIPAKIVYEDDEFIVFHDVRPKAPIHVLVVPKKQLPTLESVELDDDFHTRLLSVARKIAKDLGIGDNYQLHMNVGHGVQQVKQVHLHVKGGWSEKELETIE
ncbi:MAG: HIT domain-containing protein [Pseudomonadales bacterium]|jgi:histidine triad (HIT) family protein|nr:HIT domain-containing protein [Pseudomonadales bacterium]